MQQQETLKLSGKKDTVKTVRNGKLHLTDKKQTDLSLKAIQPVEFKTFTIHPGTNLELPVKPIAVRNGDWVTLMLVLALVVLALVKNTYSKYLHQIFSASASKSAAIRLFGESSSSFTHATSFMIIFSYLVFSMFIFQAFTYWDFQFRLKEIGLFFICFLAVVLYFRLKFGIHRVVGSIFFCRAEALEYNFNAQIYNKILGLLLFPVVLVNAFASFLWHEKFIFVGIIIAFCLYFLMLFRGFSIFIRKHVSIYYLILYLCTLEILPLVLIWKTLLIEGK